MSTATGPSASENTVKSGDHPPSGAERTSRRPASSMFLIILRREARSGSFISPRASALSCRAFISANEDAEARNGL